MFPAEQLQNKPLKEEFEFEFIGSYKLIYIHTTNILRENGQGLQKRFPTEHHLSTFNRNLENPNSHQHHIFKTEISSKKSTTDFENS